METKKLIAAMFLFLVGYNLNAQIISALVYDDNTKEPIVGASVYYDGTTIGVATDIDGRFKIPFEESLNTPIVISSIGYATEIHKKEDFQQLKEVFLKPSAIIMKELIIRADNWSREKKLGIFKAEFIGRNKGSEFCKILNEKDIKLVYNPSSNELMAFCHKPIKIKNRYLGYEVTYNLIDFVVEFTQSPNGFRLIEKVYYVGTSFFSEIGKKPKKKYLKARIKEFEGSKLNFMRALSTSKLLENKFEIFHKSLPVEPYKYFLIEDQNIRTKINMATDRLSILYNQTSQSLMQIEGKEKSFFIDKYGIYSPTEKLLFGGDFGRKRISSMLPQNYSL